LFKVFLIIPGDCCFRFMPVIPRISPSEQGESVIAESFDEKFPDVPALPTGMHPAIT
jgi:hypothetical protein